MKRMKKHVWVILLLVGIFFSPLGPTSALALEPGLYIADWGQNIVYRMDSAYNVSRFFPQEGEPDIYGPIQLAEDPDGNLVVSVRDQGTILRVSPAGYLSQTIASGLDRPHGLAFDSEGNLYVAEFGGNIKKIAASGGEPLTLTTGQGPLEDLEFDEYGNLYAARYGSQYPSPPLYSGAILRISQGVLHAFGPGSPLIDPEVIVTGLERPVSLAYRNGRLYVAEWGNYRVAVIDLGTYGVSSYYPPTGELVPPPLGLAFDETGNLYVSQENRIGVIDPGLNLTTVATGFYIAEGILYVPATQCPPTITSLSPSQVIAGGPDFILTVHGTNFAAGSVVQWNNSPRPTTFISRTELTATISAADIAVPGTVNIAVSNPPPGGGLSNSLPFLIVSPAPNPVPKVTSLNPSLALAGGSGFTLTVTGTNFIPGSVVRWNGLNRPTIFVSSTQIQASISADDIADPGIMNINVFNKSPGGGSSNSLPFRIKIPTSVELSVDSVFESSGTKYVKLKARVIDTLTGQTIYGIGYRYIYTYFYLDRRYIGMSRVNKSGTYAGYSVITYKIKSGSHPAKAVFNENEKYGGSATEIQFTVP